MDELALQSDADLQQAEHRIHGVETEFAEALGRIELAMQQVEALMQADSCKFGHCLPGTDLSGLSSEPARTRSSHARRSR